MKFGESDFGDLLASAEQLTAQIDGGNAGDLPRSNNMATSIPIITAIMNDHIEHSN